MRPDSFAGGEIFKVIRRQGVVFSELLQTYCATRGLPYVITPQQWSALAWTDEDNGIPTGVLAQYLDIEASVTTGIVQRLEQHNLLERVHDRQDRRVVKIFLTAEGKNLVHSIKPLIITFHEKLFQGFSPEELQSLLKHIQHLGHNLSTISQNLSLLLPPHE